MTLSTLSLQWNAATYLQPPSARCGHICAVIDKIEEFGTELVVIHGGINSQKAALADLSVLQVANEQWLDLEPSALGPAARAFHAACSIGPRVYIFAGHVYLPEQKRLHQFNDLWVLDTDTWQWERKDASPDHPAPNPRDRSSIVPLDDHRLLIYGGADASNRRLDDVWIYDLNTSSWSEVGISSGSKPRPRCSSTLFSLGNRVLVFGGDIVTVGPSNDLWSLRGVIGDESASRVDFTIHAPASATPQWTQLQLPGPAPAPRRGHAAASATPWGGIIFAGGRSEQKSLLGIKKQSEYLMDVVLLQRQMDTLQWRSVEPAIGSSRSSAASATPVAREKHTLCALKDGRFFLYGGTDGTTTLGDAWWLSLEDISLPETSDLVTLSDLEKQLAVQHQPAIGPPPPPLLSLGSGQQSQQQQYERPAAVGPLAGVNGSYWAGLPSSLQTVVPQLANTALTTLKGRLGYPAVPGGGDALASVPTTSAGSSVFAPPVGDSVDDEGLISLGRSFLGVDTTREELVLAAREYLSSVLPSELKLGSLPILMTDYRRIARAGWAVAVATLGPDALFHTDTLLSGRYMHWTAEDIRMKDVASILEDYRKLLAAVASGGDIGGGGQLKEEVVTEEEEEDSFIAGPPPSSEQYQEQQEHTNE
ncbi:hypothetical protein Ndes2526B_g05921 [Nannochloris sp. 'desiccata']|nr:hypothetical protein KSW81_007731 [Chlorella desiccata (nom. nud.)]